MIRPRPSAVLMLVLALSATAALAAAADRAAPSPTRGVVPRSRVLRAWDETVKVDGRDVPRRVEIVFDYDRGEARQVARQDGEVKETLLLHEQPAPTAEEFEEAVAILDADASLARVMRRTGGVPTGGFILEEPEGACGLRTRCLQILIVTPNGYGLLRRVVVDLTRRAIVYRAYIPTESVDGASR
jgi:hypothetical protein